MSNCNKIIRFFPKVSPVCYTCIPSSDRASCHLAPPYQKLLPLKLSPPLQSYQGVTRACSTTSFSLSPRLQKTVGQHHVLA